MNYITGKTYRRQTVELDGNAFLQCRFINCHLIFRGREAFGMQGTEIKGKLTVEFLDAALLTLQMLEAMHADKNSLVGKWAQQALRRMSGAIEVS